MHERSAKEFDPIPMGIVAKASKMFGLTSSNATHWLVAADWVDEYGDSNCLVESAAMRKGIYTPSPVFEGGDGNGYGNGIGYGYGDGYGNGYGDGDGYGNGIGNGNGDGNGDGDGGE